MEYSLIQNIAIYALPVIFAITLHEAAHGYAARHFGDYTAHLAGRISLNPLRHMERYVFTEFSHPVVAGFRNAFFLTLL